MGWEKVGANAYWTKHVPQWDYGMLFLVGTFLGAMVAACLGTGFRVEVVPRVWKERFGPSVLKRMDGAVIGGVLVMYGARLAGGCTSGHGISGSLQLAMTLDKLLGIPVWAVFGILALVAISVCAMVTKFERSRRE